MSELLDSVQNRDVVAIPQQKLVFVSAILQSSVKLLDNEGQQLMGATFIFISSLVPLQGPGSSWFQLLSLISSPS